MQHPRGVTVRRPCKHSSGRKPVPPQATKAPQKWPTFQVVAPPPWIPEGWTAVVRTGESGGKHKYYVDPVSKRRYWSKTEVTWFLKLGHRYRYKRAFDAPKRAPIGKRETHKEQLQKLGREFCLEAVEALRNENVGSNTLQQINMGLRSCSLKS